MKKKVLTVFAVIVAVILAANAVWFISSVIEAPKSNIFAGIEAFIAALCLLIGAQILHLLLYLRSPSDNRTKLKTAANIVLLIASVLPTAMFCLPTAQLGSTGDNIMIGLFLFTLIGRAVYIICTLAARKKKRNKGENA